MENLKEFIKKHGDPALTEDFEFKLEHTITKVIGEMVNELDQPRMDADNNLVRVMDGILIQVTAWGDSWNQRYRVPAIKIFLTTHWGEQLTHGSAFNFGETPMMQLFSYILRNEQETWITDTDVLNWNIQAGSLRDPASIIALLDNTVAHPITLREYFGNEDEMVIMLSVELNDYMS